ncbi:MAG: hypothetical protein ACRDMH_18105 [Solirubrobacterales bacterium]
MSRTNAALASLATLGVFWCLFLAPIQSSVWNAGASEGPPIAVTLLQPIVAFGDSIYRAVGSGFGTSYEFWGRLFFPAYLGALAGVLAIGRPAGRSQAIDRGRRLASAGLAVAFVADLAAYWSHGTPLEGIFWSAGFGVELVGLLLAAVGIGVVAAGLWSAAKGTDAIVLAIGLALILPSVVVIRYLPHGALLPLAATLAVVAWRVRIASTAAVPDLQD